VYDYITYFAVFKLHLTYHSSHLGYQIQRQHRMKFVMCSQCHPMKIPLAAEAETNTRLANKLITSLLIQVTEVPVDRKH